MQWPSLSQLLDQQLDEFVLVHAGEVRLSDGGLGSDNHGLLNDLGHGDSLLDHWVLHNWHSASWGHLVDVGLRGLDLGHLVSSLSLSKSLLDLGDGVVLNLGSLNVKERSGVGGLSLLGLVLLLNLSSFNEFLEHGNGVVSILRLNDLLGVLVFLLVSIDAFEDGFTLVAGGNSSLGVVEHLLERLKLGKRSVVGLESNVVGDRNSGGQDKEQVCSDFLVLLGAAGASEHLLGRCSLLGLKSLDDHVDTSLLDSGLGSNRGLEAFLGLVEDVLGLAGLLDTLSEVLC